MISLNADYGWQIDMTLYRAIRVVCWRIFRGETWRGIAYLWEEYYPEKDLLQLNGNQFYGMSVLDCAATKLGFRSYVSWPLN